MDPVAFVEENKFAEPFSRSSARGRSTRSTCPPTRSATIIHDLNRPIPDDLRGRFGLVYDGGTLEHIFHISQALKNCMEMVRVGGHFAQCTVANNFTGHGFWQVSPELIFPPFSARMAIRSTRSCSPSSPRGA